MMLINHTRIILHRLLSKALSEWHNQKLGQSRPNSIIPSDPILDLNLLGSQKLAHNSAHGLMGQFHWPKALFCEDLITGPELGEELLQMIID